MDKNNSNGFMEKWKQKARELKREVFAIYLSYKDPRVPWYAKIFSACVVAYAFSPIDLIPDFVPVLGYLDDLVLVPLGIRLAIKMIPAEVMAEHRAEAEEALRTGKPMGRVAAVIIILLWVLILIWVVGTIRKIFINK
jgi:uncharacterized membrane protein YkvA (DUF1232 family)